MVDTIPFERRIQAILRLDRFCNSLQRSYLNFIEAEWRVNNFNAGILLTRILGTNFSEILIETHIFSFRKMHLKQLSSAKWRLFLLGPNELTSSLHQIQRTGVSFLSILAHYIWVVFTGLTHWGRNKMAAVSQRTLSNAFSWMKNVRISIKVSLKFVPKGPINNIPSLVQIMAWRRPGDKPLSDQMLVSLSTHICVTRPQLVKQC